MRYLTRFFAVVGFLITLLVVAGVVLYVRAQHEMTSEPKAVILVLDFDQPIPEKDDISPLDLAMHEETSPALLDLLRAIDEAREDPNVKALVGRFGDEQPSLAQAQELSAAIRRFRTSGKPTYAFGSSYGEFGAGNRAYILASAFENVWLQPVGAVGLTGLALEEPFAKTALEKIGVSGDFMQREEYKSFMDMAMRDEFAPPVKANLQAVIDDLGAQEAAEIADNRGMDPAHVKELMAAGPYTDEEALKAGLVTHLGYAGDLDKDLDKIAGKDAQDIDPAVYLGYEPRQAHIHTRKTSKATIALIYGSGLILDRDTGGAGDLAGEQVMAADKIAGAFDTAAEDKDVKAVLFRIDSPGGSPAASETIRGALMNAQKAGKPVFVSMGGTAASGGYWVAMNADYIAAEPGTLTGSIGVVSGKFDAAGLLQKIGVTVGAVRTSANAGMWSMTEGFTPQQRARVNALLDSSYASFLRGVSDGRKIPLEKMPGLAKGRVFTGAQAQQLHLVDELGGYDVTLKALRKKLNLADTDPIAVEVFPPPESPVERLEKLFKTLGVEGAMIHAALLQWQALSARLGFAPDALFGAPVTARMPVDASRIIQ